MAKHSFNSTLKDGQIAGLYDLQETLGCGHFAVVKVARHVFTGERVAVKVIDKTKLDEISRAHLVKEVRCMKLVQHPNVVRLYEVIDTQTKLYLVQELGDGGDMYEYIMNHEQGLSEDKARHYFQQIVLAIDYCHKLHIVHRDLKLENVIFFKSLDVAKLTDFGLSNKFSPGQKLDTSCGSLAYSAPEVLLGDSYDAPAVDVWSLGVILFMLVCGRAPFYEANDSETLINIMDVRYSVSGHVSQPCQSLIEKMLVREPYHRCSVESIMEDPWFQGGHPPVLPTPVPLVTELPLTPEEHNYVVEIMETGKIANREKVKNSPGLELKGDQEDDLGTQLDGSSSGSGSPRIRRISSGRLAPREGQMLNETIKTHAIEAEEILHSSMEEDDHVASGSHHKTHGKFHTVGALSNKPCTSTNLQFSTEITPSLPSLSRPHERRIVHHNRLRNSNSAPLSLNQIHEERESDLEDSPVNSPRVERTRKHLGGGVIKSKRTTRRLSPVPSGSSRRSSSCSSSDEDEIEKHMRRLKTTSGCKLNTRRSNNDDGNTDGDSGGGTGVGGGNSLRTTYPIPSVNGANGEKSSGKNPSSKQGNNGKTSCLNVNMGVFAPLCEDLDVIQESNKENVDRNVEEQVNQTNAEIHNGKRSSLIEEYGVLASKGEMSEQARSNSFLEKRNSASKYIKNNDGNGECDKNEPNSLEGVVSIELTDMSLQSKDTKRLVDESKKNMSLIHNPAIQTVTSNCCQIF
ncbi:hypothetical protein pdam_00021756 [Pocillopora damicornis]|uniref:SNF-related serine/threonine-protein kinase n=1 Tax=Pocillopora damicornis TaxID=46731 RepID=A0A3M6U0B6_POCDA|nr:hypothetical protein pdam_00021756 [Pocillopora damicornis]